MRLSGPRIFVATAGMMGEHPAAPDLAMRMIGDERQAIFFVGYADPDTPGGRLKASQPDQTFLFGPTAGLVNCRWKPQIFDHTALANCQLLFDFAVPDCPVAVSHGLV